MFQEEQAVRAFPLRIGVWKMRADIAESRCAQQRIAKRMREHVAIRMSYRSFVKGQFDAADDEGSTLFETMQVVANTGSHLRRTGLGRSPRNPFHSLHEKKAKPHEEKEGQAVEKQQNPI